MPKVRARSSNTIWRNSTLALAPQEALQDMEILMDKDDG
jgi:hypothetical protein